MKTNEKIFWSFQKSQMQTSNYYRRPSIIVLAGFSRSLVNFRGPLLQAFCQLGLDVHVAAPALSKDADTSDQLKAWGVTCHDIPLERNGVNPFSDIILLLALYRLMRKIKPDMLLAYTAKPVIYGNIAGRLSRVPQRFALITGLGYAFVDGVGRKRALVKYCVFALYRRALSGATHVFFQNPDD